MQNATDGLGTLWLANYVLGKGVWMIQRCKNHCKLLQGSPHSRWSAASQNKENVRKLQEIIKKIGRKTRILTDGCCSIFSKYLYIHCTCQHTIWRILAWEDCMRISGEFISTADNCLDFSETSSQLTICEAFCTVPQNEWQLCMWKSPLSLRATNFQQDRLN
jgi:hypothetical protein